LKIELWQWKTDDWRSFARLCDTVDDAYDDHFVSKPCTEDEAKEWIWRMEEINFTLEGRKANAVRSKGIVYDTLLYGLLFNDWLNNNPELRKISYDFW
jgi:hypothetical protein